MELTVKLDRQDIASENLLGLIRSLQSIAREEAPKAESVKEAAPKKDKASKKEAPKAEPVKEEVKKAEPVKEEPPKTEPVKEEAEPAKEEPPKAKVIDLSEMKKRVMAIKDADNDKWDGIKNLIKQYGGGKLSAIPEDTREDFMAAVEAL